MEKQFIVYYKMQPTKTLLHRVVVAKSEEDAIVRLKEQMQMEVEVRKVVRQ